MIELDGIKVVNFMEVKGVDVCVDSLSEEQQKEISDAIQDKTMIYAGYKRKTA